MKPAAAFRWQHYHYFPYEKRLAQREIMSLFKVTPKRTAGGLIAPRIGASSSLLTRLTYFREVCVNGGAPVVPLQMLLEASASPTRNGEGLIPAVRRQSTRYSAHGLHSYRGKFNPQIVRAITNILAIKENAWILDPFCGSGTTLLEAAHGSMNAVGLELNPLGVLISNAKLIAIRTAPGTLMTVADQIGQLLERRARGVRWEEDWDERTIERVAGFGWHTRLPNFDYLEMWFRRPVLAQLASILTAIAARAGELSAVFQVILSDLLRSVSLQDPGDLRIRKRRDPQENYALIPLFIDTIRVRLAAVARARRVIGRPRGFQRAFLSDSRGSMSWLHRRLAATRFERFDGIITSPPYATALPYIDTHRLSLCALGLIGSRQIMQMERALVGTREISTVRRKELERLLQRRELDRLPGSVVRLCAEMLELARGADNGFRRRAVPALMLHYFAEMREVLGHLRAVAKPGSPCALVVGRNRTTLSGAVKSVDTPQLLAEVAETVGWRVQELIELNAYNRFDMHRKNSITTEYLVVLRR